MEKRKKCLLTVLIIAAALLLAAVAMACVDYNLVVNRHERPECAVGFATADDGGSGRYYGLGCGFEVHGNFVALDPADYGVREWSFYILGVEVASGSRDSSASTAS